MKKAALSVLALCFAALLAYSGWRVWGIAKDYGEEAQIHGALMEFQPSPDKAANQSGVELQAKYPDTAGWLSIPNTKIDYPFVWYKDNDYYLRRNLYGEYALAGTIFIDCRCRPDFSLRNTILYGHNMKNGSMFGTLKSFAEKAFFEENTGGTIFLPHETLSLEFFAYLVIDHADSEIYSDDPSEGYLAYVRQYARLYRDIGITDSDRLVTLSTCAYEFDDARMVLLARVAA